MNKQGRPHEDFEVTLQPEDFCPTTLLPPSGLRQHILVTLDNTYLCRQLDIARRYTARARDSGATDELPPFTRKRKLSSSPVEELSEADEEVIRAREERIARRTSDQDGDYGPSSRSRTRRRRNQLSSSNS